MNTKDIYLSLVRAALWGQSAVWPAEQTETLMRLNAIQGTGTMVFPMVLGQEDIPAAAKMQMKALCVHSMHNQVHLQHILSLAWQALEKAGTRPVLMKGAGLAALYPDAQMRQWGDVDLFVGKEHYHPACAAMREMFPDARKFDEELDHYKHYNLIAEGISIEIHRVTVALQHPADERHYARMEKEGMEKCIELPLGGLTVRVPDPTFNALFVFLHSWEHMMTEGANVRQMCDVGLLLHHYAKEINSAALKHNLKLLRLLDAWQLYAYILVNGLGFSRSEMLFYTDACAARAHKLLDDLLNGRMHAPKSSTPAPKNRILRKIHTMCERLDNAKRMGQYSKVYGRRMTATTLTNGAMRLFAKDRHWE